MNRFGLIGGCAVIALSTVSLWGQDEEVKVRVRAIAAPDGKVEVVEETVEGNPKPEARRPLGLVRELTKKITEQRGDESTEAAEPRATIVRQYLNRVQDATKDEQSEAEKAELPQSDYWIGVQIGELPPEVRKHMSVKHGILIQHVYPDSPAAQAELVADDILIQAGDAKIETAADLIKAVDGVKEGELHVKLLREGTEKSLTIKPVKRPQEDLVETQTRETQPARLQAAERELQRALAKLQEANAERAALDFMLVRPGAYVYGEALAKLPDDVSIQVTKEGSKPAKVVVKQGEKSYEGAEGKLENIPKELRPHVERLLSGAPSLMSIQKLPATSYQPFQLKVAPPVSGGKVAARVVAPVPVPPVPPVAPAPPAAPAVPANPYYVPAAPGAPPPAQVTPASPRIAWLNRSAVVEVDDAKVEAKLDQILKKLDSLGSSDLEEMKRELKALRKEVDSLQKKASGSESSR